MPSGCIPAIPSALRRCLPFQKNCKKRLQDYAYRIVEDIGVIGGTNVQFAHDPETGRVVVIEINPRTSRSSALASKATGFPIALISALLAGGLTLDEIPYWREGTLEKYTPWGDYVVVKFANGHLRNSTDWIDKLGTQMQAVGEVMSIGKNYKEAFQKAIRSLETGRYGLGFAKDFNSKTLDELMLMLKRCFKRKAIYHVRGAQERCHGEELHQKTYIKAWFIEQMKELVELEEKILAFKETKLPDDSIHPGKKRWFCG
jgi:carbamoyl-phosphate synthase large subunit